MISQAALQLDGITIRKAAKADLPAILAIYNYAIVNTAALLEYNPYTESYIHEWFQKKEMNNFPVFVACKNESVVGFCSYGHFRERPGYKYTVESTVYIDKNHRGKGIGKLLVGHLNEYAESCDVHTIIAVIESSNKPSINLHRKFGYVQVAEFKEVGFKFNRWQSLLFFQLLLPTPKSPNDL